MTASRRPEVAALVGSVLLGLAGAWWHLRPSAYPFGPDDRYHDLSLMVHVTADQAVVLLILSAALSGLVGVGRLLRVPLPTPLAYLGVAVAAAMAVAHGYLLPDIQVLILIAYSMTLALPALAVFVLVSRRGRTVEGDPSRRGATAAVTTLVLTLAGLVVLGRPWEWGSGDDGESALYRPLLLGISVLVGAAWALVALRWFRELRGRCVRCGAPRASWATPESAARWGRVVTWAAALTPLPYVVARLTWLTPWPYGESPEHLAAHPGLWVFGLGLAAAGELGTWLTLGLVRRRGEVFPRWVPGWGGSPVPVMAAVVPGLAVALLMSIGGHSVVQQAFGPGTTWEDHSLVLFVPLPLWGPLLGLGTLAYWYRRRPPCDFTTGAPTQGSGTDRHRTVGAA